MSSSPGADNAYRAGSAAARRATAVANPIPGEGPWVARSGPTRGAVPPSAWTSDGVASSGPSTISQRPGPLRS